MENKEFYLQRYQATNNQIALLLSQVKDALTSENKNYAQKILDDGLNQIERDLRIINQTLSNSNNMSPTIQENLARGYLTKYIRDVQTVLLLDLRIISFAVNFSEITTLQSRYDRFKWAETKWNTTPPSQRSKLGLPATGKMFFNALQEAESYEKVQSAA